MFGNCPICSYLFLCRVPRPSVRKRDPNLETRTPQAYNHREESADILCKGDRCIAQVDWICRRDVQLRCISTCTTYNKMSKLCWTLNLSVSRRVASAQIELLKPLCSHSEVQTSIGILSPCASRYEGTYVRTPTSTHVHRNARTCTSVNTYRHIGRMHTRLSPDISLFSVFSIENIHTHVHTKQHACIRTCIHNMHLLILKKIFTQTRALTHTHQQRITCIPTSYLRTMCVCIRISMCICVCVCVYACM